MELTERPDLLAVQYLNSIPFSDFKDGCIAEAERDKTKTPKLKDIKTWYNGLKQYCKTVLKTKGITKRIYSYSEKTKSGSLGGRLFSGGSIQGIWNVYRGLLLRGIATDIDMENCHPVLLRYICNKHNIMCLNLDFYIKNRDQCLSGFETRKQGKTAYLSSVNDDKHRQSTTSQHFREFDREMKRIQKELVEIPEYKQLLDSTRLTNYNGSAVNRILCYYENRILQSAISVINAKGIEIAVLMFDGLIIYGNHYDNQELLDDIREAVNTEFAGLDMNWTYKEFSDELKIPPNFNHEESLIKNITTYESVKTDFELTHAKIIKKGLFIDVDDTEIHFMTKQHISTSYEHMVFETVKNGDILRHSFIKTWFSDPEIKTYSDVGYYPKQSMCPEGIFNMWRPFAMELIDEYEHREDELQLILNHVRILCGNEEPVFQYFIAWIAQMIQYPEIKTICPTLISSEGAGKGTLIKLMDRMLGNKKVFETTSPSEHIWGQFNGALLDAFLINLNEISKKDTIDSVGKIKGLITDPTVNINIKGIKAFSHPSYHRFIACTNSPDPIVSKSDDRRTCIIRSSDELIGNKPYFNHMHHILEDVNVIKTVYEYLKSIPNMDKFNLLKIPTTEYHRGIMEGSECPIKQWIRFYAQTTETDEELSKEDVVQLFDTWKHNARVKYEVSAIQLMVRISRLKLQGIEKIKGKLSNTTKFNIEVLREELRMA